MFANTNITIPFKERQINLSKPVRIYRNLTKKVFGIALSKIVLQ